MEGVPKAKDESGVPIRPSLGPPTALHRAFGELGKTRFVRAVHLGSPVILAITFLLRAWLHNEGPDWAIAKSGDWVEPWQFIDVAIPILGVVVALSILLDKVTDSYDDKLAAERVADVNAQLRAAEDTAASAVSDLTTLLGAAIRAAEKDGTTHSALVAELPETLVMLAAKSVGTGTRATYYALSFDESGMRVLSNPVHYIEYEDRQADSWLLRGRAT